ncbi:MAG TPA: SEC-C metal-binding domain-containing protein, partial [Acidobacteriota bacterium]
LGGTDQNDPEQSKIVRESGGLHVIGTERHEARRIDNQLRGRAGRQGDAGSTQFFLSLEDEIMRIFGSDRIKRMMESFGIPEDQPIENKMVSKAIEAAQAKIEGFHFDSRKHVLDFDDVLNKQRSFAYRLRNEILRGGGGSYKEKIMEYVEEEVAAVVNFHTAAYRDEWNLEEIAEVARSISGTSENLHSEFESLSAGLDDEGARNKIKERALEFLRKKYGEREEAVGSAGMWNLEKVVLLQTIDMLWMDHLDIMEHLRDSVRLRAYGQRDPLVEYKNEGAKLFKEFQAAIRSQVVNTIYKVGVVQQLHRHKHVEERKPDVFDGGKLNVESSKITSEPHSTFNKQHSDIGRNDPCPCGSGKKYKKCHGA